MVEIFSIISWEPILFDIAPAFLFASSFEVNSVLSNVIFIFTSITSLYFFRKMLGGILFFIKTEKILFFFYFFQHGEKDVDGYTGHLV